MAVGRVGSTTSSIKQRLVLATKDKRQRLALLGQAIEDGGGGRTLVFVKKKATARWVAAQLRKPASKDGLYEIPAAEIHGDRSQSQRESALRQFRGGEIKILVATDVAARGLDIAGVEHVINFDLVSAVAG